MKGQVDRSARAQGEDSFLICRGYITHTFLSARTDSDVAWRGLSVVCLSSLSLKVELQQSMSHHLRQLSPVVEQMPDLLVRT